MLLRSVRSQTSQACWPSLWWSDPVVSVFSSTMQLAPSRFTIFPTMALLSTDSVQVPFLIGFFHILTPWEVQSHWQYAGQTLNLHLFLCMVSGSDVYVMCLSSSALFYLFVHVSNLSLENIFISLGHILSFLGYFLLCFVLFLGETNKSLPI